MSDPLHEQRCQPLSSGSAPLSPEEADSMLTELADKWQRDEKALSLRRTFSFDNYHQTMSFVNAVAWIAHQQDHHPDLLVRYGDCTVTFSTHSVGGLSANDFICAARVGRLLND